MDYNYVKHEVETAPNGDEVLVITHNKKWVIVISPRGAGIYRPGAWPASGAEVFSNFDTGQSWGPEDD